MLSTAIFVYAATSPVNGYFGGSLYAKQGGKTHVLILILNVFTQNTTVVHSDNRERKLHNSTVQKSWHIISSYLWSL